MAKELKKGLFIVLDGPDGCGKSTQSRLVYDFLKEQGYDCIHTAEPGGTELGLRIREVLLNKETIDVDRIAELFLFEADRAQHIAEVIKPALKENKIIICDRFHSSTFAYQGFGLGMDMDLVKTLDEAACDGVVPDLTVILDIDSKTGLARAKGIKEQDKMEKRGAEFHQKVRNGFLQIAKDSPERIKVVSVQETIDETYQLIKSLVSELVVGS